MYCPRCGSLNKDTTKFCRQCGLPMTPVTGYVASGGTGALTPTPPPAPGPTQGLTPKQTMTLTILLIVMSPAIFGILAGITGMGFLFGRLAGLSAVLLPFAIVWTIFRYKAQMRHMRQMQWIEQQQQMQLQSPMPPQHQRPPIPPHVSQPTSRVPTSQPPTPTPSPTNPLGNSPGSVTEDETRRLPDHKD